MVLPLHDHYLALLIWYLIWPMHALIFTELPNLGRSSWLQNIEPSVFYLVPTLFNCSLKKLATIFWIVDIKDLYSFNFVCCCLLTKTHEQLHWCCQVNVHACACAAVSPLRTMLGPGKHTKWSHCWNNMSFGLKLAWAWKNRSLYVCLKINFIWLLWNLIYISDATFSIVWICSLSGETYRLNKTRILADKVPPWWSFMSIQLDEEAPQREDAWEWMIQWSFPHVLTFSVPVQSPHKVRETRSTHTACRSHDALLHLPQL